MTLTDDRAAAATATPPPLVSVITIFLDAERFLADAIESVLAQTHREWELLLVDDGSSDGGPAVALAYASAHPDRIRYLTHPGGVNRGMSRSRQLGLEEARGEFVAFLDADDVYLPEKLERQVAVLREHAGAVMVYGPTPHWDDWADTSKGFHAGHVRRVPYAGRLGVAADTLIEPPELVRQFLRREADTPATCGVLVRRDAALAVGGFEHAFTGLYEDQVFFYKLCLHYPVFVESRAWDRYRQHPDSFCAVRLRSGEHADDYTPTRARGAFLRWLDGYFRRNGVRDRALWTLLRRERWPFRHPWLYAIAIGTRARGRAAGLGRISRVVRRAWRRVSERFRR